MAAFMEVILSGCPMAPVSRLTNLPERVRRRPPTVDSEGPSPLGGVASLVGWIDPENPPLGEGALGGVLLPELVPVVRHGAGAARIAPATVPVTPGFVVVRPRLVVSALQVSALVVPARVGVPAVSGDRDDGDGGHGFHSSR